MIKAITFLLLASTCFGQVTMQSMQPFFNGTPSASGFDGTFGAFGGLYYDWPATNFTVGDDATNWVDLVQGRSLNWNRVGTKPKCTQTGALTVTKGVEAFADSSSWLSNNLNEAANGIGTNIALLTVMCQSNQLFAVVSPIFEPYNQTVNYFGDTVSAQTLQSHWSSVTKTFTGNVNNRPIDVFQVWSNGVYWAWTNGISAMSGVAFNNNANNWIGEQMFAGVSQGGWFGTIRRQCVYTNANLYITSATVVSNLHYLCTNIWTDITP